VSTARSPRPAACCTTPVATRLTRATGDWVRRREPPLLFRALLLRPLLLFRPLLLLRPLLLRPDDPLLDLRDDFRPPLLRRDDDLRPPRLREELRELPELRLLERFLAPPRLRPDDPARFLPLRERLDFLAAAMGMLHVLGFVAPIARFAHNTASHLMPPVYHGKK
jgi:hypothetical protein